MQPITEPPTAPTAPGPASGALGARRRRVGAAIGTLAAGLVVVEILTHPSDTANIAFYLSSAIAVAVTVTQWVRTRHAPACHPPGRRSAGVLVMVVLILTGLGEVAYKLIVKVELARLASIADLLWLSAYAVLGAAIYTLVRSQSDHGRRAFRDLAIDIAVAVVLACLCTWYFYVDEAGGGSSQWLERGVKALYPVLDIAVVVLIVRTMFAERRNSVEVRLAVFGMFMWFLPDMAVLVPSLLTRGDFLRSGWMISYLTLAYVSWSLMLPQSDLEEGRDRTRPLTSSVISRGRIVAVVGATFLVPWAIFVLAEVSEPESHPIPALLASLALSLVAVARMFHLASVATRSAAMFEAGERRYRAFASNSSDAVAVLDPTGRVIDGASSLIELVGGSHGLDPHALTLRDLVVDDGAMPAVIDDMVTAVLAHRLGDTAIERELRFRTPDDSPRWFAARMVNLLDDPDVSGIVLNVSDVTTRKHAETELVHLAFHDPLTGLANRVLLVDRLQTAIDQREEHDAAPVVLYIDIDGFKAVNDALGHRAGDVVLREVADRIVGQLGPADTAARVGGDEFVVLTRDGGGGDARHALCDRLIRRIADPIAVSDRSIRVSASIGTVSAETERDPEQLVRNADIAMYRAKRTGRGRAVAYAPSMGDELDRRFQIENDLHLALRDGQFRVEYQPVVDIASGAVTSFEALIRWDHPHFGPVPPDLFIPIAERTGFVVAIDRWVLRIACDEARRWNRARPGTTPVAVAVNISGAHLSSGDVVGDVVEALEATGIAPGQLIVEITETAVVERVTTAGASLDRLRAMGVRVAIDDFGTGYSSMTYLQQMPVDIVKIDRSFLTVDTANPENASVTHSLIDLAHHLGYRTVVEGIEHQAQLDRIGRFGGDAVQGYLFSPPMRPEAVPRFLDLRTTPDWSDHTT